MADLRSNFSRSFPARVTMGSEWRVSVVIDDDTQDASIKFSPRVAADLGIEHFARLPVCRIEIEDRGRTLRGFFVEVEP